ncbi:MAG TPA: biotin--[acetyl-CoA-carboxylase] ligase [Prolixibacteraceae bacterium]|nr:biotin--[acetyl-CoA-carboxylase] ligase [Prolixibacteraceae bacterium]
MADIIGKNRIALDRVDSTNNYANTLLADSGWPEGTVVVAEEQTHGRGLMKNRWESAPSENLLASIIFYPSFLPVQNQFLLSKVVALGIFDTLKAFTDQIWIKWPNDLYVGERKIAGILIENSVMGSVIQSSVAGLGINLNQEKFFSNAPNPLSLCQIIKRKIDRTEFQELVFDNIEKWYLFLQSGKRDTLNQIYQSALFRLGIEAAYTDQKGAFRGTLTGVNETGQLMIRKNTGETVCYFFKEVEFVLGELRQNGT